AGGAYFHPQFSEGGLRIIPATRFDRSIQLREFVVCQLEAKELCGSLGVLEEKLQKTPIRTRRPKNNEEVHGFSLVVEFRTLGGYFVVRRWLRRCRGLGQLLQFVSGDTLQLQVIRVPPDLKKFLIMRLRLGIVVKLSIGTRELQVRQGIHCGIVID